MEEIKYVIPPYGTRPSCSFCGELRQRQKCVILCMVVTTTILCCSMFEKLDFQQLKLVGLHVVTIKCHQPAAWVSVRQSAAQSSLSSCLGHWLATLAVTLPPQFPHLSLSLSLFSLHLSLNQGAVTHASLQPFLPSLTPWGSQPPWCRRRLGAVAVDKAAGLQKTHQLLPLLWTFRKLSAPTKERALQFNSRAVNGPDRGTADHGMLHIPRVPNKKRISSNQSGREPCSLTVVMTAPWWMIVNTRHKSRLRVDAVLTHAV